MMSSSNDEEMSESMSKLDPLVVEPEPDDSHSQADSDVDASDTVSKTSGDQSEKSDSSTEMMLDKGDDAGLELSEMVLQPFTNILKDAFGEEVLKKRMEAYPIPTNAGMLTVPKLNDWLEESTRTINKQHDLDLQNVQHYMVATMSAVATQAHMLHTLRCWAEDSSCDEISAKAETFIKSYEMLMDANRFMTRAMYETNQVRRNLIKLGLSNSLSELLIDEHKPSGEWLAGEDWSMQAKTLGISECMQHPVIKLEPNIKIEPYLNIDNESLDDYNGADQENEQPSSSRTADKTYMCSMCPMAFNQASDVIVHMGTHMGAKPYKCSECGKGFRQAGVRNRHMKTHKKHLEGSASKTCLRKYGSKGKVGLRKYGSKGKVGLRKYGSKGKLGNVSRAKIASRSDENLEVDKLDDGPYYDGELSPSESEGGVDDCDDSETCTKQAVVRLQRKTRNSDQWSSRNVEIPPPRSDEKTHMCSVCPKAFSQAADVIVHMRTHTGVKPFKCSECGKGFCQSGVRNRHMKTHTSENLSALEGRVAKTDRSVDMHSGDSEDGQSNNFSANKPASTRNKTTKAEMSTSAGLKPSVLRSRLMSPPANRLWEFESLTAGSAPSQDADKVLAVHAPNISECISPPGIKVEDSYIPILPKVSNDCDVAKVAARNVLKDTKDLDVPHQDGMSVAKECQKDSPLTEKCEESSSKANVQGDKRHVCCVCSKNFGTLSTLEQHMRTHTGEKPHACLCCGKGFSYASGLHCHMKLHSGAAPYVCNVCGKGFVTTTNLRVHMMKSHPGAKPHQCPVCKKGYSILFNLDTHMASHACERSHKCTICGKSFSRGSALRRHGKVHCGVVTEYKKKSFVCSLCNKVFIRASYLKHHMHIHTGETPYTCKECGKGFKMLQHLNSHLTIHTGVKPFVCNICGNAFRQNGTLVQHMLQHTGEKPHVCSECGEAFTHKNSLKGHMTKHTGVRPYLCSQCGKGFVTSGNLKTHMLTHTNQREHSCHECGKKFREAKGVRVHMRTHTGDKPYICPVCGVGFSQSGSLKVHKRIHTGERPYVCTHCGKGFAQSGSLTSHLKTHTNGYFN